MDKIGARPARSGKLVKWLDGYGNAHNLDFVLERGGSYNQIGTPVAFIESAWRRYTKHSKNKAQEIQGAVVPVRDANFESAPFMGCFLVGDYTSTALDQLRSIGFHLLYFPYATIIDAFRIVGIDAHYDEQTADDNFAGKQRQWDALESADRQKVWDRLLELNRSAVDEFMDKLQKSVERQITSVRIVPLHGDGIDCPTIAKAIEFIKSYDGKSTSAALVKYEVQIRYDNNDKIDAQFRDQDAVINFLERYKSGNWSLIDGSDDDIFTSLER